MSEDISLLPEGLRKKEEELKKTEPAPDKSPELKFSMPAEEGEDIEVIEVDEGEIEQVLAGEPLLSRVAYKVTNFIDAMKSKLFQPNLPPPPPKLPPQFFAPPPAKTAAPAGGPKPVPQAGVPGVRPAVAPVAGMAGAAKAKVQIMPSATTPRRVRVIKRVRKPVRVSFVSDEELKLMHVDIPKRRFTFITAVVLFALLIGGGYALLGVQLRAAQASLATAKAHTTDIQKQIADKQAAWSSYKDLEPRLKALGVLLDQHVSPTRLLELIEKNTLPTVSYGTFSLTPDGKVGLSVTADSLESAAGQIVAFQNSGFIKKVDASSYSVAYETPGSDLPSAVTFQVTLTLSDTALHAPALAVTP